MRDERLEKYARILVNYSVGVEAGNKVYLSASVTSMPLVRAIYREVIRAGAHPILDLGDDQCGDIFYEEANDEQLVFTNESLELEAIRQADRWITIWGEDNTRNMGQVDPKRIVRCSQAYKPIDDLFTERTCAIGKPNFLPCVGTQFPCQSAAQDAEMSLSQYEDFVFKAAWVDAEDPVARWKEFELWQKEIIEKLSKYTEFRFTCFTSYRSDSNTDITFKVPSSERKWYECAGRENFPDGEIYTSPLEDSANGIIEIDFASVHNGVEVRGVKLEFENGKLVESSADSREDFLHEMVNQDPGASRIGELAFGVNSEIKSVTKNTLFDEKIGGTFHIALGDAYPNTGGTNKSQLHWDMIIDMRKEGKVFGDGKLIQENGEWTKEFLLS